MNTIQTPQKYVPRLHLKSQLRLRPSVKFQMHILAPCDKRLPMHALQCKPGVGKLFTRRARFGKTVEAAGRTLIGKQGEDLFFGDHGPRTNVIYKRKGFHLVFSCFLFQFCTVEAYFFENHCHP